MILAVSRNPKIRLEPMFSKLRSDSYIPYALYVIFRATRVEFLFTAPCAGREHLPVRF